MPFLKLLPLSGIPFPTWCLLIFKNEAQILPLLYIFPSLNLVLSYVSDMAAVQFQFFSSTLITLIFNPHPISKVLTFWAGTFQPESLRIFISSDQPLPEELDPQKPSGLGSSHCTWPGDGEMAKGKACPAVYLHQASIRSTPRFTSSLQSVLDLLASWLLLCF